VSSDDDLAHDLAAEAGKRLLALRASGDGPDDLRKAGDRLSHEFLTAELAARRPADAVLSEEGKDDPARLAADRVWIVDPLDGTREFGETGRTDWAVHVALWERGELTAGAVALPAQGQVLSTATPPPPPGRAVADLPGSTLSEDSGAAAQGMVSASLNGSGEDDSAPLRVVVSRSRPPDFALRLAELLPVTLVPLGSAGAKAAAVICGEADAYLHDGGQYEWDSAAPVAVARSAGLHASRLDGSNLEYNRANPWLPDILICPAVLAAPLVDAIRVVRNQ
jgi:3'(2'), 5'-bisphosphate nucleotidase